MQATSANGQRGAEAPITPAERMKREMFDYKIVEHIATLSTSSDGHTTKELNRVSYRGAAPKYDLRSWRRDSDGEKLLKGLTLTDEEMTALKDTLEAIG